MTETNNDDLEKRTHCCDVEGERCTCLPYNDYLIILASCFAFVAFLLSWIWYVILIIALPGVIGFQLLWCCRQSAFQLYLFAALAGICSLINIGVGIYWNTSFGTYTWCTPFMLEGDGNINEDYNPNTKDSVDDYFMDDTLDWFGGDNTLGNSDICWEGLFAILSYACGLLWGMSCIFTICFVKSGRHAKREFNFLSAVADPVELELPPTAVISEYEESTNFAIPIVVPTALVEESATTTNTTAAQQADNSSIITSSNYGR